MAQPPVPSPPASAPLSASFELPAWKGYVSLLCAVLLALLFLVAGVWKSTDPLSAASRMVQALLPPALSLPTAVALGISEVFAGVLLLIPRFRRWGAWLTGLLLIAFLLYIGINYSALQGEECNCFPMIKRAVGPAFFIGDVIMLAMAVLAGLWAAPSRGVRPALVILGAVSVFGFVFLGVTMFQQSGLKAPESLMVDGKPMSLQQGRVFLYFYDPQCAHCYRAAQQMGKWQWKDVTVVALATASESYAQSFLDETGFKAKVSPDAAVLRKTFAFTDPPYGVAIEHGRQKAAFIFFDDNQPHNTLQSAGWIE